MYSYFNNNPIKNKRVGDCVIRAISKALNQSWEETYIDLAIYGLIYGDIMTSNILWGKYLKDKGFTQETISKDYPDFYSVKEFCKDNPEGMYILALGTHVLTVIDGIYYDTWESGDEVPIYVWSKK